MINPNVLGSNVSPVSPRPTPEERARQTMEYLRELWLHDRPKLSLWAITQLALVKVISEAEDDLRAEMQAHRAERRTYAENTTAEYEPHHLRAGELEEGD